MRATGRDIVRRTARAVSRTIPCVVLCLALAGVGAPALASDRDTLTGQLVPVTGEPSRSVDLAVAFAKNAADLTEAAREQLDELGAALEGERLSPYDVGVYGHTDASGPAAYNLTLSKVRAEAVVRYLVERFGFEAAWFRHEGYGEERLLEGLAPNAAAHRRVEIVVFAPPTQDAEEARRYDAEARAIPSDSLYAETASGAAMNLARARVVAQALGIEAPAFEVIRSEAEGVAALKTLAHGIPMDEQIKTWEDATGERHVWLKARVATVGGRLRPAVEAALTKSDLKAGEKFRITLSASASVHVGMFAWGADGGVVRFYPNKKVRDLIVPAGGRVSLPLDDDEYRDLWSAPLPGHAENHEAIIVVASVEPLDFEAIGSIAGKDIRETMSVAIPAGSFFNALGELDLSQATLLVLPYRVRR